MAEKIKVAVIFGPTASGKTRLAATLARRHNGEVVSADSMQIYREWKSGPPSPQSRKCWVSASSAWLSFAGPAL